ncbi:MAG TPA: hypothetical protein PKI20_02810 [Verrucomicrobiota bacterium]|nr:hypothetical protein [Verrucomicrobiota bacterium]HQL77686.1 hypothetical protein [Verrucomicrobiota bacterium]
MQIRPFDRSLCANYRPKTTDTHWQRETAAPRLHDCPNSGHKALASKTRI